MITFTASPSDVQLLGLLVSVVLPALVALLTKRMASSALKSVTLLALAAVLGFGTELLHAAQVGASFDVRAGLMSWLTSFVVAVVAHYGVLKPGGVTGSQGAIAAKVPGGLGTDVPGKHSVEATIRRAQSENGVS